MPGFNRTGPMGAGPMTGGARGLCNPYNAGTNQRFMGGAGYGRGLAMRRGFRGGYGPGRGRGYGPGYGWYPPDPGPVYPADTSVEIDMLKAQAGDLKNALDAVHKRIDELGQKPAGES